MKELTIGKLKAGFSRIIDDVLSGEEYTVLRRKNKQKVAMIIPYPRKGKKTLLPENPFGLPVLRSQELKLWPRDPRSGDRPSWWDPMHDPDDPTRRGM